MPSLLGIDNGLTVTKAVVFDIDGTPLSVARRRVPQLMPKPRHVERAAAGFEGEIPAFDLGSLYDLASFEVEEDLIFVIFACFDTYELSRTLRGQHYSTLFLFAREEEGGNYYYQVQERSF